MEKFGLDNVKYRDYPLHLQSFRKEIRFARYIAAGKYGGGQPNWCGFAKWYDAVLNHKNESDTSPTAQDQIPMPVD
ncbi:hypothetical protein MKW92_038383, partial [Papaver armeniacum]